MYLPYQNPEMTPVQRTNDLLSRMTLDEKVGQMIQVAANVTERKEIDEWIVKKGAGSILHVMGKESQEMQKLAMKTRLGIPLLFGIDAIHGHALHNGATVFPSQLAMSCSWNPQLVEKAGRITAREVAADGLHWAFSPVLCVGRDLRWGRIDETFGEDPYLIGILASAIIRGYQGDSLKNDDSILACAKHYLAYGESTGGRDAQNTPITIRKARTFFLPPFKRAVEAGCATFMTAYLPIDGTPMTASARYLKDILKEEYGFSGFVVTDWNNTGNLVETQFVAGGMEEAAKIAVQAGNDMIMHTPEFYHAAISLVKKGDLPESLIDEAVGRILKMKFAMGLFDERRWMDLDSKKYVFACKEHVDANMQLTRESIVLLENKEGILPLDENIQKIAVIGPNANDIQTQFGDWTFFSHPLSNPEAIPEMPVVTVLEGIKEEGKSRNVEVIYHKGCDIMDAADQDIDGAVLCARNADAVVAVVGDCLRQNGEAKDRAVLDLSGAQTALLKALKKCGKPLVVVLINGKPLSVPWLKGNADAVIEAFNPGMMGGKAVAEILFGKYNPCGKLSISFPYHTGQLPVYYNQIPGWHGGKYMDLPDEPLYPFGYGLSYTTYEYSNLKLSKTVCGATESITVMADVENTGIWDGYEIVQVYVRDDVSSVITPVKQLKGFTKVFVKAGERVTVKIPLDISQLYVVMEDGTEQVEHGTFTVMVGSDSRDKSLMKAKLEVVTAQNKNM